MTALFLLGAQRLFGTEEYQLEYGRVPLISLYFILENNLL